MRNDSADSPSRPTLFHRARLEYWALVGQLISAVGVVISLAFVGIQLRDGNRVATRAEANATQSQWSAFNASIYGNAETADILEVAISGRRRLSEVEAVRFAYLLREQTWLTYQGWERVRVGMRPRASFYEGAGIDLVQVFCTPGGRTAWPQVKREFPSGYVVDLDTLTAEYARSHPGECPLPKGQSTSPTAQG